MVQATRLSRSYDRKVSPLSAYQSKGYKPKIGNAFGLPAGTAGSCPGATQACESVCYAAKTEKMYKAAGTLVRRNYDALLSCDGDVGLMTDMLDEMIAGFMVEHRKVEAKDKKVIPPVFRIHWDGDFFSVAYAEAWARVVSGHPEIQFWVYTRSFQPNCNVVPVIAGIPNLAVYLSVDAFNEEFVSDILQQHPDVKLSILDKTYEQGQERAARLLGRKAPRCPENKRKVPLVNSDGEGACVTCGLCIDGKGPVLFSSTHK